jgi:hypothetical protein
MTDLMLIAVALLVTTWGSELALQGRKLQTGVFRVLTVWACAYVITGLWLLFHNGTSPIAFTVFWCGTFLSWFGARSHVESSILLRMLFLLSKRPLAESALVDEYLSHYGEAKRVEELCRGGLAQKDHEGIRVTAKGKAVLRIVSALR